MLPKIRPWRKLLRSRSMLGILNMLLHQPWTRWFAVVARESKVASLPMSVWRFLTMIERWYPHQACLRRHLGVVWWMENSSDPESLGCGLLALFSVRDHILISLNHLSRAEEAASCQRGLVLAVLDLSAPWRRAHQEGPYCRLPHHPAEVIVHGRATSECLGVVDRRGKVYIREEGVIDQKRINLDRPTFVPPGPRGSWASCSPRLILSLKTALLTLCLPACVLGSSPWRPVPFLDAGHRLPCPSGIVAALQAYPWYYWGYRCYFLQLQRYRCCC